LKGQLLSGLRPSLTVTASKEWSASFAASISFSSAQCFTTGSKEDDDKNMAGRDALSSSSIYAVFTRQKQATKRE